MLQTLKREPFVDLGTEPRSRVKVEVAVMGSPFQIVRMVSVDRVKQH